jgi:hypothetical protein
MTDGGSGRPKPDNRAVDNLVRCAQRTGPSVQADRTFTSAVKTHM